MTRKDYEAAARIVQDMRAGTIGGLGIYSRASTDAVETAFAQLFVRDNPRFDEDRFRRACVPGANVRARG